VRWRRAWFPIVHVLPRRHQCDPLPRSGIAAGAKKGQGSDRDWAVGARVARPGTQLYEDAEYSRASQTNQVLLRWLRRG